MKIKGFVFCISILFSLHSMLYSQIVPLANVNVDKSSKLNKVFFEFELVTIQYDQLKIAMSSRSNQHFLHFQSNKIDWELELYEHDIHTGDYLLQVATDHGIQTYRRKPANTPMIGYLRSSRGGQASMVVAENYLSGMVEQGGAYYFIEPANGIDPALPDNYLVIYNRDHIIQNTEIECGYELYKKNLDQIQEKDQESKISNRNHCLQIEIAISNDFTVYTKKGSVAAVENWNTTLLTLLGLNYDDEFEHNLEYVQSASFVATSTGSDPWNGINNINTQLDRHRSWANGGGYGAEFDVATNWTTKYSSGAVGLAWLGVVCTNSKYNVCSDYGGSNNCLRQLQAHELGHNFGSGHDGSGNFIMAPSVNCSSAWSSQSIASINTHINSRGCLTPCSGGTPPEANFTASPTDGCTPFTVQFTDLSTNDPTNWNWSFPGGTPSSSTQRNPIITYKVYGVFDVTLRATNPYGSNTLTQTRLIYANSKPVASFTKVIIDKFVYFTNTSQYGGTYEWDFGDGESSNDDNPIHEYANDGVYDVVLRAENECGLHEVKMTITIVTIPIALFVADTTRGCATKKIKFINLSSRNVTSWKWDFPGGTPSTSTVFEPEIEYKNPGSFDVKLTASNSKYKAVSERLKYINIDSTPVAAFDSKTNLNVVDFTNKSIYAKTWLWEFGDSTTSVELNPSHTYKPGTYKVKLTVYNICDTVSFTKEIIIQKSLNAGFTANQSKGCVPFEVQFTNTSIGANFYQWVFPGGNPSASTEQNPKVTYNIPGNYDVSLTIGDAKDTIVLQQKDFIEVQQLPEAEYISSVAGFEVYFTNQSKYGTSYLWDFGDGSTGNEAAPVHKYTVEGEYLVSLITTNDCGSDTLIKSVAVFLIPKVDFKSDTTVICASGFIQFNSITSSDVHTWQWQFDGGIPDTSSERHPKIYYSKKGNYSVKLVVQNTNGENELIKQSFIKVISPVFCPEDIFFKEVASGELVSDPLRKQFDKEDLVVYPNPFYDDLVIQGNSMEQELEVQLFDLMGKMIHIEFVPVINKIYFRKINLEKLNAGAYLLKVKGSKNNITKTVVLSR